MRQSLFVFTILVLSVFIYSSEKILKANLTEPDSLDPPASWNISALTYEANIFDTLLKYDEKTLNLIPSLATKWKVSKDGKKYTLFLRKGVKFHDGSEFKADSVVFTFRRGLSKEKGKYKFPVFKELFKMIKGIKKIDNYTVEFELNKKFSPFLYTLTSATGSIVSPNSLRNKNRRFCFKPIGTGPFIFKEWKKGDRLTFVANKNYWGEKPAIDVFINVFPKNFGELSYDPLLLMKQNIIDFSTQYSLSKMVSLKKIKWIKIKKIPLWGISFLSFNLKKKIFHNVNFRKALSYLWNEKALRYIYQDYVIPVNSLIPPNTIYSKENNYKSKRYNYSLKKAKYFLRKANIKGPITLKYYTYNSPRALSYEMILRYKNNLKKAGIDLKIEFVNNKEYVKLLKRQNYDLLLSGFIADYPELYSFFSPLFSEEGLNEGISTFFYYKNFKQIRNLLNRASELPLKERIRVYKKVNEISMEDAICIPIMQVLEVLIYKSKIKGLNEDILGTIFLNKVSIDEN